MFVFAHQSPTYSHRPGGHVRSHTCDVDEKTGVSINPPGIYHIELVGFNGIVRRIDLEHIIFSLWEFGRTVMVYGHVVEVCQEA